MADEAPRSRLGRGLAALIGDVGEETATFDRGRGQRRVPIEFVKANPANPRRQFDPADLQELAESIRERGIIQPIVVRATAGQLDSYEIVAGERRWRAAQLAGLHEVPIQLVDVNDREALEIAIIENVQRSDLNALDEAFGYERLVAEFGYQQQDLAKVIGKSRSHVANTLRLLRLPESVKAHLVAGRLTPGHARALLAVPDPAAIAEEVVAKGLNVRAVETLAQEAKDTPPAERKPRNSVAEKDEDTLQLERALAEALGLKVTVDHRGPGGTVKVAYRTLEQLDELCRKLKS